MLAISRYVGFICGIRVQDSCAGFMCGIRMQDLYVRFMYKICVRDLCAGFVCGHKGGEKGLAESTFESRLHIEG